MTKQEKAIAAVCAQAYKEAWSTGVLIAALVQALAKQNPKLNLQEFWGIIRGVKK